MLHFLAVYQNIRFVETVISMRNIDDFASFCGKQVT